MKIFLLLILTGIVASQRSELVDYILDLQYAVGYIHNEIQDTTARNRRHINEQLTETVHDAMTELTNGLSVFLTMRDRYTGYIEEARTAETSECVDRVTADWSSIQSEIGAAIGACGANTMEPMHNNLLGFHEFVNSHRQLKFDAQNIVLNSFTRVNPITQFSELTPTVEKSIDDIFETYQRDVASGMSARVRDFGAVRETVPSRVHDCVADALNSLSSRALEIVDAANGCADE